MSLLVDACRASTFAARRPFAARQQSCFAKLVAVCVTGMCLAGGTVAEPAWPVVRLPNQVSPFVIGEQMAVNGLKMRLHGFVSTQPAEVVVQAWRSSLGQPLVEDRSGTRQILGRAQGRFYITVQIEAEGAGSRGTVAITDLGELPHTRRDRHETTSRWLDRLPAGSTIASDIGMQEGGKASRHLVIMNRHGEQRNRDALIALLSEDGYRLERIAMPTEASRLLMASQFADAATMHFTSAGKEATAVIVRNNESTAIILTTSVTLQAFK